MNQSFDHAIDELKKDGLHVVPDFSNGLFIAASIQEYQNGLQVSQNSCVLFPQSEQWVAIFPGNGQRTYEIHGQLSELILLIKRIYSKYRQGSNELSDAFANVVENHEEYLI